MSFDIVRPVSSAPAMLHITGRAVAPLDVELGIGAADELPRHECSVLEDLIIGEHEPGDDLVMFEPCAVDDDDLLSSDLVVKQCTKPVGPDHTPEGLPCPSELTRAEWVTLLDTSSLSRRLARLCHGEEAHQPP